MVKSEIIEIKHSLMAVNSILMTQMLICHAQNQKIHIDNK